MEEKKLTDEEIVKALECLAGHKACDLCKYDDLAVQDGERTCVNIVAEEAIDIIHRLQNENARLTIENATLNTKLMDYEKGVKTITVPKWESEVE